MEDFLKMDIFFFITTITVVVTGVLASVCLYYLMHVLRDIRDITATVKKEAEGVVQDIHEVRKDVREGYATAKQYTKAVAGAGIIKGLSTLFQSFTEERGRRSRRAKRPSDDTTENE